MTAVECTPATAEQVGFNLPDDPAKDTVILESVNVRDMVKTQKVQQHDGQNHLAVKPALGTETFTGKPVEDLPVGKDLQERQDTGKGGRVLEGGKFGLDWKGFFNYHHVHPLGCCCIVVMIAGKCRRHKDPTGFFYFFDRRSGRNLKHKLKK